MSKFFLPHLDPSSSFRLWGGLPGVIILAGCVPATPPPPPPMPSQTPSTTPIPTRTPTVTPTATATDGPGVGELLMTPNALVAAAQLDDALAQYGQIATLYPYSAEPLLRMAAIAQRQNDADAANRYFEAAATADPTNRDALRQWAIFLEQQGRYDVLAQVYDQLVDLDPQNPDLLVARAMANARLGNSPSAANDLTTAMALDPHREYAWLNVAGAASGARQYKAAIEIASAGLDAYPQSTGLLITRGLAYLSLKDPESAIKDFDAILALDANNAGALHWKGRALIAQRRYSEAAETLKHAADIGVDSGVDGVNLAYESMAYAADAIARTDVQAAFEYLAGEVIHYGSRDALLMGYGLVRWRQGNTQLALDRMDSLVEAGFVPALYWRGAIFADQGEKAKAITDLKAYLKLRNSGPDVEAARDLLQSLGVDPDQK